MAFILMKDRPNDSLEEFKIAYKAYNEYLESIKDKVPKEAYEFATATTKQSNPYIQANPIGPRSRLDLHDAWLESMTMSEPSHGDRSQYRSIDITLKLLGPYHDGHIEIVYKNVKSYSMIATLISWEAGEGHGDWMYDEIRLSEQGNVLHEIEWSRGSDWLIEFKDFAYQWIPFK